MAVAAQGTTSGGPIPDGDVGPPPLLTEKGIVMLYNGKNSELESSRDPSIGPGAYSAGQALLDPRTREELS